MFGKHSDKIHHIVYSYAITLGVSVLLGPVFGVIAGILAGLFKEVVWDLWMKKGKPDEQDMAANMLGIILAMITFYI